MLVGRLTGALVGALLLGLAGCGNAPVVEDPQPFDASSDAVPIGWREVLCPGTEVTVRLVVPDVLENGHTEGGNSCGWSAAEIGRGMGVTVGPTQTLAAYRKKYLGPYESEDGDDAVNKIRYHDGVTVLGDEQGERLDWYSFSDGSQHNTRALQGAGVRLTWSTPAAGGRALDDFAKVVASVAVIDGAWHQCSSGTTRVRFQLPPVAESVESFRGHCVAALEGAPSVQRRAEVTVRPTHSLADQARSLVGRPGISRIRLEHRAAMLLGRKVDRLTWLVTRRPKDPDDYSAAGTWRVVRVGDRVVQVTWGATPAEWEAEHAVVEQFLASVRLP